MDELTSGLIGGTSVADDLDYLCASLHASSKLREEDEIRDAALLDFVSIDEAADGDTTAVESRVRYRANKL